MFHFGLVVSGWTVNRCRNEIELQYLPPIRSAYISGEAAVKRQFWTKFYLDNYTHFRKLAFSDESWFQLDWNNRWVWFDKNSKTDAMYSKSQQHLPKVMVWMAIGWNFKSELIILDHSVNSAY